MEIKELKGLLKPSTTSLFYPVVFSFSLEKITFFSEGDACKQENVSVMEQCQKQSTSGIRTDNIFKTHLPCGST